MHLSFYKNRFFAVLFLLSKKIVKTTYFDKKKIGAESYKALFSKHCKNDILRDFNYYLKKKTRVNINGCYNFSQNQFLYKTIKYEILF